MTNGKDRTMNAKKNAATRIAGNDRPVTAEWLTARMRNGRRRVEVLGWKRLAAMWVAARPGGPVRRAIAAECRRCGYTPQTILALNAEE
jgi:microcystin degradation protein MlrC